MRQGLLLTGFGIAVWGAATLFFRLFGSWVLIAPGESHFGSSLFMLELLTLLVLIGLAVWVRLKWFPRRGSATRFGFTAAAVGLFLDTFSVWQREAVFPSFTAGQHHAFTIWMTLAYAMMLVVPAAVDRLIREKASIGDEAETRAEDTQAASEEENRVADADGTA
ncbi:hypothetical protein GE107_13200 [Cohnella sp. CFH 77786]|uniref:hypothetical protein n=1 Tax=Cohnella sp. CFH 77786 TaxID=2662265 RepID=UPI001C6099B1|nr:hypothetical protein [Cohnella sp. CFH 77786]MBW5447019.1 hypothetical protein [Cohnella sp. CFH 77786]